MSHETHHEEHHHEGPQIDIKKSRSAFSASFWFVLILAGLFIASLNFITAMSHDDDGHGDHKEATSNQTMHGETGTGVSASHTDADKAEANHNNATHDATPASEHGTEPTEQH